MALIHHIARERIGGLLIQVQYLVYRCLKSLFRAALTLYNLVEMVLGEGLEVLL